LLSRSKGDGLNALDTEGLNNSAEWHYGYLLTDDQCSSPGRANPTPDSVSRQPALLPGAAHAFGISLGGVVFERADVLWPEWTKLR
jgi:hypothetical protein